MSKKIWNLIKSTTLILALLTLSTPMPAMADVPNQILAVLGNGFVGSNCSVVVNGVYSVPGPPSGYPLPGDYSVSIKSQDGTTIATFAVKKEESTLYSADINVFRNSLFTQGMTVGSDVQVLQVDSTKWSEMTVTIGKGIWKYGVYQGRANDSIDEAVSCTTAPPKNLHHPHGLSVGSLQSCVIDDGQVKCWGQNVTSSTSSIDSNGKPVSTLYQGESLKNPKVVSTGWFGTCAIDDNGLKCWGTAQGNGQVQIDPLANPMPTNVKNPSYLKVGGNSACVTDDKGLECWGDTGGPINGIYPSGIKSTFYDYSGQLGMCILTLNNEILCNDGDTNAGSLSTYKYSQQLPALNVLSAAESSTGTLCVISAGELSCRGMYGYSADFKKPAVTNITAVAVGALKLCFIDAGVVKCAPTELGINQKLGTTTYNAVVTASDISEIPITNATEISGGEKMCALGDQGIQCW